MSPGGIKRRTLIASQKYFGLEAWAFHSGAKRMLERIRTHEPDRACVNTRTIAQDFCLDAAASGTLLRAFMASGLLYPDGDGRYEATDRFREYALADIAVPLSRLQARDLINTVCGVAARINAEWQRSPLLIDTIMASGSYMGGAKDDLLSELPLWLMLRFRRQPPTRNPIHWQSQEEALDHIKAAIKTLSPIIVVNIVSDSEKVQRPFRVVFQQGVTPAAPALGRLRDWEAPLSQRPVAGPAPGRNVSAGLPGSQPGRAVGRDKSTWDDVSKRG